MTDVNVPRVTLIGGGEMIMQCVDLMHQRFEIQVITADRQSESLNAKLLSDYGCRLLATSDINTDEVLQFCEEYSDLCLCFGPAWILSKKIINIFDRNIFNFNAIPIPDYVGGAHYTWQILNGDKQGAVVIQRLTEIVDRGEVVAIKRFKIEGYSLLPSDYEHQYFSRGVKLLQEFLAKVDSSGNINTEELERIDWNQKSISLGF